MNNEYKVLSPNPIATPPPQSQGKAPYISLARLSLNPPYPEAGQPEEPSP